MKNVLFTSAFLLSGLTLSAGSNEDHAKALCKFNNAAHANCEKTYGKNAPECVGPSVVKTLCNQAGYNGGESAGGKGPVNHSTEQKAGAHNQQNSGKGSTAVDFFTVNDAQKYRGQYPRLR